MKFVFSVRKLIQVIVEFLSTCIIDRNANHFLEPYEEKTSYTFLGGALFIYIYPNKLSIESLQLMFDLEEKEEIFEKWVFMIR